MRTCSLQRQLQPAPVSETCMHPDVPAPAQNVPTEWEPHEGFPVPQPPQEGRRHPKVSLSQGAQLTLVALQQPAMLGAGQVLMF